MQMYYFKGEVNGAGMYWVSSLGKFSIADVFVICILMGVCNLTVPLHPESIIPQAKKYAPKIVDIIHQSVTELEAVDEVCNKALALSCRIRSEELLVANSASCTLCITIAKNVFEHPTLLAGLVKDILSGLKVTGEGVASLRVSGLPGLHVFCSAVLVSMILSLFIEINCNQNSYS